MPIYAYRCEACGFAKDALQKVSDAPLTDCPACGEAKFKKQLTAAGFQLKGTGWYVTDFRNGSNGSNGAKPGAADANKSDSTTAGGESAGSAPAGGASDSAGNSSSSTNASGGNNSSTGSAATSASGAASGGDSAGSKSAPAA